MWERVQWVFTEAFGRLGAVLADDLPGIVAMLVVVLVSVVFAFAIRSRGPTSFTKLASQPM